MGKWLERLKAHEERKRLERVAEAAKESAAERWRKAALEMEQAMRPAKFCPYSANAMNKAGD